MPVVHLPQALTKYANGQDSTAVVGKTVAEALTSLAAAYPDLAVRLFDAEGQIHRHLAVIHGDESVPLTGLATRSVDADESIRVLIAVSGG